MTKYHIGDDGQPRPCNAKIKCPKGSETPHFSGNQADARVWAEEQNTERAGGSFGLQKGATQDKSDADEALAVSQRNLAAEKNDLEENKQSYNATRDELDSLKDDPLYFSLSSDNNPDLDDLIEQVSTAESDMAVYENAMAQNEVRIKEIQDDIEFAKKQQAKERKEKGSTKNTRSRKTDPNQSMADQERDYAENIVPNSTSQELVSDFRSSSGLSAVTQSPADKSTAEKQANIVTKELKQRLQDNAEGDVFFDREKVKVKTYHDSKYVRSTLPEMDNDTLVDHYNTRASQLAAAKNKLDSAEGSTPNIKDTDTYLDYVEQEKHARKELEERLEVAADKKP